MNPKEYIENIRKRQLSSDKEFVLDSLTGAIDRLQKAFPRYESFLMEFVQNADDAKSTSLRIEIKGDVIRIYNDGKPFSEEDVKSICKVGRSSKTPRDYIGYLGVGFKSVFLISNCPEIHSGAYHFKFDKNAWDDPEHTPWQVIPIWIDEYNTEELKKETWFILPLKTPELIEKIKEEIKPEHMNNRMLLFLRNIEKITIVDYDESVERRLVKSLLSKTSDYEIYQIREHVNEELVSKDRWLIFRRVCSVPLQVKEDYVTKEWERDGVGQREVLVAFRLDEEDNLTEEEKGTAHIGVFSFLPLKDIPSGLNFLIQADFLTGPGRGELARECLWNNWLAEEIYKLIIEVCIPVFIANEKWRMNFVNILYSSWGGHPLFENNIKAPLRKYLETEPCLISSDGSIIRPSEAVKISDSDIMELLTESDLRKLYPNKKVVHPDCQVPWEIETQMDVEPRFNANAGPSDKMEELLNIKLQEKDVEFFIKFYHKYLLFYKNYSSSTISKLKSYCIILTEDFELTNANSAYIKPKDLTIPEKLRGTFKFVHQEIASDSEILEMLKILGVNELTSEHIQDLLKVAEIYETSTKWNELPEAQKIEKIKSYFELWKKRQIDIRDLSFLTLKTKSEKWFKPEEIILSEEYHPDHQIEKLIKKGLLDLPVELLSDIFIQDISCDEIPDLREFFKKLGVDKKLQERKFRRDIAVSYTHLTLPTN